MQELTGFLRAVSSLVASIELAAMATSFALGQVAHLVARERDARRGLGKKSIAFHGHMPSGLDGNRGFLTCILSEPWWQVGRGAVKV